MKKIGVMGSTGSIGTQTLEIVRSYPDKLKVVALAAGKNVDLLEKQIREFKPSYAVMWSEEAAEDLKQRVADLDVKIGCGMDGLLEMAVLAEMEILVTAIVGMIGIRPTIEAIKHHKDIALANKETLVTAGHIIMPLAKENNVSILPVDSEHSAIFQSLQGNRRDQVKRILLTASGGPFRGKKRDELANMTYQETAYAVMKQFFTDFTEEELKNCINKAYDSKFDTKEIAPLVDADGAYYLELFHGPTIAFKDMALSILPHLLITSARKNHVKNDIVILTATSGDTGKAALAGFADVEGTKIIVFYPKNGVSPIQEKQMVTQKGANTFVVGIHGNFDQAQTGVKKMFNDSALAAEMDAAGYQFSSANSINIGRLVPQVVYYVYAYARLYKNGVIAKDEKINVVVPTGNFGNILAAFYAKNMGLPIGKLICASNENKVLFDFFSTGTYDRNREFILTSSPSMDILISSNLERLIYRVAGNDAEANAKLMASLSSEGKYAITDEMKAQLADFYGNYTSEDETASTIKKLYEDTGYIIDTHTAVAAGVYDKYKAATGDTETKTVIASTASPFKFTRSVMDAIDEKYDSMTDFELVDELSKIGNVAVPQAIEEIRNAKVLHDTVCEVEEMPQVVKKFLGV